MIYQHCTECPWMEPWVGPFKALCPECGNFVYLSKCAARAPKPKRRWWQ